MNQPDIAEQLIEAAAAGNFDEVLAELCEGNFIKSAIKHPGSFTAQAGAHGESPAEFQHDVLGNPSKYSGRTVHRANLRKTLVHLN